MRNLFSRFHSSFRKPINRPQRRTKTQSHNVSTTCSLTVVQENILCFNVCSFSQNRNDCFLNSLFMSVSVNFYNGELSRVGELCAHIFPFLLSHIQERKKDCPLSLQSLIKALLPFLQRNRFQVYSRGSFERLLSNTLSGSHKVPLFTRAALFCSDGKRAGTIRGSANSGLGPCPLPPVALEHF